MGDVFPELKEHEIKIREIIADEEASFGRTLTKVCVVHLSISTSLLSGLLLSSFG